MHKSVPLFSLAAFAVTAFMVAASILISSDDVLAVESPAEPPKAAQPNPLVRPSIVEDALPGLDDRDRAATLESIRFALDEVADGASYVWRRTHGRLSGVVHIASSFKGERNSVCRKAVVVLASIARTARTDVTACRAVTRRWTIEG
jgi:surface antigen